MFITLDNDHLNTKQQHAEKNAELSTEGECDYPPSNPDCPPLDDLSCQEGGKTTEKPAVPPEVSNSIKLRRRLQEKIDGLRNTAFLVHDPQVLTEAIQQLESLHVFMKRSCPSSGGLPLRASPVKKKLKITKVDYHQVFHKKLPQRKRWNKKKSGELKVFIDLTEEPEAEISRMKMSGMKGMKVCYIN